MRIEGVGELLTLKPPNRRTLALPLLELHCSEDVLQLRLDAGRLGGALDGGVGILQPWPVRTQTTGRGTESPGSWPTSPGRPPRREAGSQKIPSA